ncbi:DNA/RNA non-specific endonuclease [Rhodobacter sp. NSM]|uniref:DNA/RNA non-specific endonuclease n=1 Tax=Rhodobacter sp. NSM TaxID=3457501 RepID=UPI003FD49ACD
MRNGEPERFENVLELQTAHLALMQRQQDQRSAGGGPVDEADITAFLDRVRRTGTVLATHADRRIAQRVLDYWTADLLDASRGYGGPVTTESLLPYEPVEKTEERAALAEGRGTREYIRLAAQARQWRDTRSSGYLLSGKALRSAERFGRDPEIADLITASLAEERREARRARRRKRIAAVLTLGLVTAVALAGLASLRANFAAETAAAFEKTNRALSDDKAILDWTVAALDQEQQMQVEQRQVALANATEARSIAQSRIGALAQRQAELDAARGALADIVVSERLSLSSVPDSVREDVLRILALRLAEGRLDPSALAPDVNAALAPVAAEVSGTVFNLDLKGYDPDFLGRPLPLPGLTPLVEGATYLGGEAVPYLHHSVIYDRLRPSSLISAVNFDRAAQLVLPATSTPIEPDPRLPPQLRPDPSRFDGGLVSVDYVDRAMIAWGDFDKGDPVRAARMLDQSIQIHLNKAPVHPATADAWSQVVSRIREIHNSSASRVSFFTGPIFRRGESKVPASLWLIAVSLRDPVWVPKGEVRPFVAEAFLIPNRPDTPTEQPWHFAITVDGIERATGLRFPSELVAADRGRAIVNATEGDRLAGRAIDLNAPAADVRRRAMHDLVQALESERLAGSEQAKIVSRLIDMLANTQKLRTEARIGVTSLLAGLPPEIWSRSDWIWLKGKARRAVVLARENVPGPEEGALLDRLAQTLGLDMPQLRTVMISYASLRPDTAQDIGNRMKKLGWNVPSVEWGADARGMNEVRYNPQEPGAEADAQLLAADLMAAGRTVARPVADARVDRHALHVLIGGQMR